MSNSVNEQSWWLRIFQSTTWLDAVLARGLVPFLVGRDLLYKRNTLTVLALRLGRTRTTTSKTFTKKYSTECYDLFIRSLHDCIKVANGTFYVKRERILLYTSIVLGGKKDGRKDGLELEYLDDWTQLCVLSFVDPPSNGYPEPAIRISDQKGTGSHLPGILHHSLNPRLYRGYLECLHQSGDTAKSLEMNTTLHSAAICYTDEAEMVRQISAASSKYGIIFNLPRGFCIDSAWKPKIRNVSILLLGSKEYSNDRRLRL